MRVHLLQPDLVSDRELTIIVAVAWEQNAALPPFGF